MSVETFNPSIAFGPEHAANYDDNFIALSAVKDMMHLVLQAQFSGLPETAHILIAGAGTGAEARFLAALHPSWHFTLVDPSSAMLDIARKHAEAEGFADRCLFHPDYLSTLADDSFDAATSLLVSHFLNTTDARTAFFQSIAKRLRPGAPLVNADLCANLDAPAFPDIMALWQGLIALTGANAEAQANYAASFGRDFACHTPSEVEAMIEAAGFAAPAQCFQAALIRGWITARR